MTKIIEHLGNGFGIGNSVSLSADEENKLAIATDANLSQTNITENMQSLLNETISNTILKNSNNLKTLVIQTNNFNLNFTKDRYNNCPPIQNLSITNVNQVAETNTVVTSEIINNIKQDIKNDIQNDVRSSVIKISDIFSAGLDIANSFPEIMEAGFEGVENMGSDVDSVFNEAFAGAGIGNKFDSSKSVSNDGDLKMKLGMDQNDTISEDSELANKLEQSLSLDNIQKIINEVMQNNDFTVSTNQCVVNAEISNIEQINKSNIKIESITLNTVVNEISNTLTSNIDKVFQKLSEKASNQRAVAELGLAAGIGIVASGGKYRDNTGKVVNETPPILSSDLCESNANNNCLTTDELQRDPSIIDRSTNTGTNPPTSTPTTTPPVVNTLPVLSDENSQMIIYGILGLIGLIILIIVIKLITGGGGNTVTYVPDKYYR
jgi:hypothetical protein